MDEYHIHTFRHSSHRDNSRLWREYDHLCGHDAQGVMGVFVVSRTVGVQTLANQASRFSRALCPSRCFNHCGTRRVDQIQRVPLTLSDGLRNNDLRRTEVLTIKSYKFLTPPPSD